MHMHNSTCPPVAGKVYGAQQLLQRSSPAALSVLHLFSSLAAFCGAAGQAGYAAANSVLDYWAHTAQSQGWPGLAVQWGNWGGGGMAVRSRGFVQRMERLGLGLGEKGSCPGGSLHLPPQHFVHKKQCQSIMLEVNMLHSCAAVEPAMGLSVMSLLLPQAAAGTSMWSWQQAVFLGKLLCSYGAAGHSSGTLQL